MGRNTDHNPAAQRRETGARRKSLACLVLSQAPSTASSWLLVMRKRYRVAQAEVVGTPDNLNRALKRVSWDLVLGDVDSAGPLIEVAARKFQRRKIRSPIVAIGAAMSGDRVATLIRSGVEDWVEGEQGDSLLRAVDRALRKLEVRRKHEQAEARLGQLGRALEQCSDLIIITDRAGRIEYVNNKFTEVTGFEASEVIGQKASVLKSGLMPAKHYQELWSVIAAGGEWRGEFENRRKNGEVFWTRASITAVKNARNEVTHFVAVQQDVTERRRLETQFLRAQRMEGIGTLASGLAHDLNNVLTPIMMALDFLGPNCKDPESRELTAMMKVNLKRGADIVRQVLTFARGVEGERVTLSPRELIQSMVRIAAETFPKLIEVRCVIDPKVWSVSGDATQLHQVLLNLSLNARDAMPRGGVLCLKAENEVLETPYTSLFPDSKPGRYVRLEVTDTGSGIPEGLVDKIFDPFFTTKPPGHGTGLGLSTALGIVKSHQGFLNLASRPGCGTTFKIYLPAAAESARAVPEPPPERLPRGKGQLILVVDDERPVRQTAAQILSKYNYRIVLAADGREALEVFRRIADEVEIVLTDLMMPVMDGAQLIPLLREIRDDVKIVVSTGLKPGLDEDEAYAQVERADALIQKPYTADNLIRVLAQVAERKAPSCATG